jgi:hypothetical protein
MSKIRKKGKNRASRRAKKKNMTGVIWIAFLGVGIAIISLAIWVSTRDNTKLTEIVDATAEVKGGPSLKVDKEIIDFGDRKLGEVVTAEFQLTNAGDKQLRFSELPFVELKAGC